MPFRVIQHMLRGSILIGTDVGGTLLSVCKLLHHATRPLRTSSTSAGIARACALATYVLALTFPLPVPARAQERTPGFASAFLPAGHWAIDAARRLDELGLAAAGFGLAERSLTRREVAIALRDAAARAEHSRPAIASLAHGYWERFREEFGSMDEALDGRRRHGPRWESGSVGAGYQVRRGQVLAGSGGWHLDDRIAPTPLGDLSDASLQATMSAELFPHLAVSLTPERKLDDWAIGESYAVAVWRGAGIWAGRRMPGYGPAIGGGLTLNAAVPLDGVGFFLVDPLRLPWLLRHLGPVRFEAMLSRLSENVRLERPWFFAARASLAPHPRLQLGATRATMFGGDRNAPVTGWSVLEVLLLRDAGLGGEFENQVISLDASYRPPLALPVVLYLEWGFEDMDWFFRHTPAAVGGVKLPSIPGLPALSAGLEYAAFAGQALPFRTAKWYRHWAFHDGWTVDGTPLGHPLGGHGTEWRGWTHADLLNARLRLTAQVFLRDRNPENLFAPDREGHSNGVLLEAELRAAPKLEIVGTGATESGTRGWRQSSAQLGVRWLF